LRAKRRTIAAKSKRLETGRLSGSSPSAEACIRAANRHQGRIWMEASATETPGSVFFFAIPLRRQMRRRKEMPA